MYFPFEPASLFCYFLGQCQKVNRRPRPNYLNFFSLIAFPYFFIKKKVSRETITNNPYLKIQYLSSKKFIQNSFLHTFFFVLTQKRNKKSQDGSKRNFPLFGNFFGRTVLFISEAGLGSKNRRLENITLFGAQRVALAQTFFGFSH